MDVGRASRHDRRLRRELRLLDDLGIVRRGTLLDDEAIVGPVKPGPDSSPSAALIEYHERSKHHVRRYAPGPGSLDWANQPDPFRTFEGAPRVRLPLAADTLATAYDDVRAARLPPPAPVELKNVALLFELAFGLSAWKTYGGNRWALRCNPSSGNLHPTEAYVVCGPMEGLAGGVHHYVSRDHALEQRADARVNERGLLVGISSIHWREAWKYGMRAWRYCQHDCGHAIAAVAYAAAALGWQTRMVSSVSDETLASLLGLDRGEDFRDAEDEAPDALLWIGDAAALPDVDRAAAAIRDAMWHGNANRLSAAHVEWPDIEAVHRATVKPSAPAAIAESGMTSEPLASALHLRFADIARQRRSAVDFDGATRIEAQAFFAMLDCLLPRASAPPWNALPWSAQVHPAFMVHRVDGLAPGLYILVRDPGAMASLKASMRPEWLWQKVGPGHLPLFLLLPYDLRAAARLICCHQDIAADSCFALGMLARFDLAIAEPWRYRHLFWECGMLGHVLYLEAEAAGIRATGIGCFFDDEMHELLGLSGRAWQSLYHFTAGGPLDDPRLSTLPPYAAASRG
jgi:SagB-type dehydrogenase family enzyme